MRNIIYSLTKYILVFFLASFVGWLYEMACVYMIIGSYIDRGVLHLPICPIYGFGILVLYFIFRKTKNPFIILCGSIVITTAIEYLTAVVAEYKFHLLLWTYEGWPLNFRNRISAISSLIFGLLALLFLKIVIPGIEKIYSSKYKNLLSILSCVILVFSVMWELVYRYV